MPADIFDTASVRSRVLASWAASPARFREDANAEEELIRGAYRDRLVVELAQNAADAAVRARVPGRLMLRCDEGTLVAANVGARLDAAGVEALSTLRASAKRDDDPAGTVGRFGVGFAAVLAVTDAPSMISRSGGVRWSRADTVEAIAAVPELTDELARRRDAVPVLRLPFPAEGDIPQPYDTAVVLPLRDEQARILVADLLAAVDDALLLALPGLAEMLVEVDGVQRLLAAHRTRTEVVVVDGDRSTRWRLAHRTGRADAELLAERPVEERMRPHWSVTVAVPVDEHGAPAPLPESVPRVVHAPTPTDDRTDLPALVIATFPLDSSRRRVVPGALTDQLVAEVAAAYGSLAVALDGPGVLELVPGPLGASELDAALTAAVVARLAATPLVPAADGTRRLRPDEVVLVTGLRSASDPAAMARVIAGIPMPSWWRTEPLRRLGARDVLLAEVVDELGGLTQPADEWRALYAALDGADPSALGALPVPLADGRTVRGPRDVFLPTDEVGPASLVQLGLRVAHPEAAHPLLRKLGAVDATPAVVLRSPALQAAVAALADDEVDAGAAAGPVDVVLDLVAAAGIESDAEPWLARLPLSDATGEPVAAGELLLPDSAVLDLLDIEPAEHTVAADVVRRWGVPLLLAVGVREGFPVVRDVDVPLDEQCRHDLDDEPGWVNAVLAALPDQALPPILVELTAVRDLDLVRADHWATALAILAVDPMTRPALVEPAYVQLADGSRRTVPAYTVWWLREHAFVDGRRLGAYCAPAAEPALQELFPPLAFDVDPAVTRALGLPSALTDADPGLLLDRLADPSLPVSVQLLAAVYAAVAGVDPSRVEPPARIRVPDGPQSRLAHPDEVVVAPGPQWLQLGLPAVVPGPDALAHVLDVELAADVYAVAPVGGVETPVPDVVGFVLPSAPQRFVEHDDLVVAGRSVEWWVDDVGAVHAATADGLARGLAWAADRWGRRFVVAEVLRDPSVVNQLLAEQAFD
ncbi:MAG TPA: hypothetical protein VFH23_16070 [Jiangellaceae bacterium]|jgi:hypothetical protein|nr:hypothetical protein [Jiangellaceae bacterium]